MASVTNKTFHLSNSLMRYLYINAAKLELRDEAKLSLARMQELVGGYLEEIWSTPISFTRPRLTVLDNEEGLLKNLPPNVRFPKVYSHGNVLRGPVVIMAVDPEGEQTDLSDDQLARVTILAPNGDYPTLNIRED